MKKNNCVVDKLSSSLHCPSQILAHLPCGEHYALWESAESQHFESSRSYQRSQYSYIALFPRKILRLSNTGDPLTRLETELPNVGGISPAESLAWGAFGILSYDAARHFDRAQGVDAHLKEPDLYALFPGTLVRLERRSGEIVLLSPLDATPNQSLEAIKNRHQSIGEAVDAAQRQGQQSLEPVDIQVSARLSFEDFCGKIKKAKDYISAGDAFQIVFSNCFEVHAVVEPLTLFQRLSIQNPSAFHFLFKHPAETLVGASPERMLRVSTSLEEKTREISMRLVAGTYPKKGYKAGSLESDPKERAEHMMLVDHIRSDVGRVSREGSVRVPDLLCTEAYRDVFHLVSEVCGELRDDTTALGALRAVFPIATLTGTPKLRAMEIIRELEGSARGYFGGAAFVVTANGELDSTVIIRSAVCRKNSITIRAGGGIVSDSVPEREYNETYWKAEAVFEALKFAIK